MHVTSLMLKPPPSLHTLGFEGGRCYGNTPIDRYALSVLHSLNSIEFISVLIKFRACRIRTSVQMASVAWDVHRCHLLDRYFIIIMILSYYNHLPPPVCVLYSAVAGWWGGFLCALCRWRFGLPLLLTSLAGLVLGTLLAAVVMVTPVGKWDCACLPLGGTPVVTPVYPFA